MKLPSSICTPTALRLSLGLALSLGAGVAGAAITGGGASSIPATPLKSSAAPAPAWAAPKAAPSKVGTVTITTKGAGAASVVSIPALPLGGSTVTVSAPSGLTQATVVGPQGEAIEIISDNGAKDELAGSDELRLDEASPQVVEACRTAHLELGLPVGGTLIELRAFPDQIEAHAALRAAGWKDANENAFYRPVPPLRLLVVETLNLPSPYDEAACLRLSLVTRTPAPAQVAPTSAR